MGSGSHYYVTENFDPDSQIWSFQLYYINTPPLGNINIYLKCFSGAHIMLTEKFWDIGLIVLTQSRIWLQRQCISSKQEEQKTAKPSSLKLESNEHGHSYQTYSLHSLTNYFEPFEPFASPRFGARLLRRVRWKLNSIHVPKPQELHGSEKDNLGNI